MKMIPKTSLANLVFDISKEIYNHGFYLYGDEHHGGYNGSVHTEIGGVPFSEIAHIASTLANQKQIKSSIDEASDFFKVNSNFSIDDRARELVLGYYKKTYGKSPSEDHLESLVKGYKNLLPHIVGVLSSIYCTHNSSNGIFRIPNKWTHIPKILTGIIGPLKVYGEEVADDSCQHTRDVSLEIGKTGKYFLNHSENCVAKIKRLGLLSCQRSRNLNIEIDESEDKSPNCLDNSTVKARKLGNDSCSLSDNTVIFAEEAGNEFMSISKFCEAQVRKVGNYAGSFSLCSKIEAEEAGAFFFRNAKHCRGIVKRLGDSPCPDAKNCLVNDKTYTNSPVENFHFDDFIEWYNQFPFDQEDMKIRYVLELISSISPPFIDRLISEGHSKHCEDSWSDNCRSGAIGWLQDVKTVKNFLQ